MSAALRLSAEVNNATIVCIICDRGDRYLSTGAPCMQSCSKPCTCMPSPCLAMPYVCVQSSAADVSSKS